MTCKLCSESPEYAPDQIRRCGFGAILPGGLHVFDPENFHCATLSKLKSYAVQFGKAFTAYECGRIWVLPYPLAGGWIILTGGAAAGRVDSAVYMEDGCGYLLPLPVAEKAIEYYGNMACAKDCEVLP